MFSPRVTAGLLPAHTKDMGALISGFISQLRVQVPSGAVLFGEPGTKMLLDVAAALAEEQTVLSTPE